MTPRTRPRAPRLWPKVLVWLVLVALIATAWGSLASNRSADPAPTTTTTDPPTTTTVRPATTTGAPSTTAGAAGVSLVDRLVVAPELPEAGYDRGLFVHWIDADGDGCDTRCEVLADERLPGGGWLSSYDGTATADPSLLDIDHVVALAEAWRSGASGWDPARRQAFANDLDEPGALVAVSEGANRSKGDRDPALWQPPERGAWCGFATGWVATKLRWGLTADPAEVAELHTMLATCG